MTGMNNTKTFLIIPFFLFTLFCFSYSQNDGRESFFDYTKETIIDDAYQIFDLGIGLIQAPFHFNSNDLLHITGVGFATSSLFLIDQKTKELALQNQTSANDKIFEIDRYFNGRTGTYAGAGLYVSGFLFKQEKVRLLGLHALEALFVSSSITSFLKYSFGRRRPYAGEDHMSFKVFRGSRGMYRAFPSGHTTSAFTFASVMAMSIDNIYWKSIWYGGASMVGLARIYHNVHWISDTFLAAVISYNIADFVVHHNKQDDQGFSLYPSFNGFQIRFYF